MPQLRCRCLSVEIAYYSVDLTMESLRAPAAHSVFFAGAKTWSELSPEPSCATGLHITAPICPSLYIRLSCSNLLRWSRLRRGQEHLSLPLPALISHALGRPGPETPE
jgi:hypothetical protein